MSPEIRRRLAAVTPEDVDTSGRPVLYGYGWQHLAALAGRARRTVREAAANGIPLELPAEAVAWALSRRGRPDLADDVLEALGRPRRYTAGK